MKLVVNVQKEDRILHVFSIVGTHLGGESASLLAQRVSLGG